jgi:Fe-S-cluster containining protein
MVGKPPVNDPQEPLLWKQWSAFAGRPEVHAALTTLYADISAAIAQRGPTCWVSGKCCKFDSYGHLLYVTGLEIAWMLQQPQTREVRSSGVDATVNGPEGACAFQVQGLCSVHTVRPLGCRVYFCQQGTQEWQNDLYEQFQQRLRNFHDEMGIEYRYMEWRSGVKRAIETLDSIP